MATNNKPVDGHASKGNQAWCFEFVCECKARFNAKTAAARRQMWLDHLQEVRDARALSLDFDTLVAWARRDQSEAMQLAGARERLEVADNFKTIDRVEKTVRDILAERAR
jgi:hypothetical protein